MHIFICRLLELLMNSLFLIYKKLYVFNFFLIFLFLLFYKQNIYALEPLKLEPLLSFEKTEDKEAEPEKVIVSQREVISVNERQRSSEQRGQFQNLAIIIDQTSTVSNFFGNLYRSAHSRWERYIEERREEAAYQRVGSIENLITSNMKSFIEIEVPTINDHIRADVERWRRLSLVDRNDLRSQKQGIIDKYGLSLIPLDIRNIVIQIENRDAEQTVYNWSSLTYAQRRGLRYRDQSISSYYSISSLSMSLQNLIAEIEANDEQRRVEMEDQWARLRTRATGAERFLVATDNIEMEEYQFLGVKLFPVHRSDYVHPRTSRNSMELSLVSQNVRLEIHSSTNLINYEVLAEDVQEIQLSLECPDQPFCKNNIIRFNSGGGWHEYSLDQLVDYQNTGSIRYIRIVPNDLVNITDVGWDSVMKSYRGSFRIQFAKQTRTSELFEWSFINDLHIEDYNRSVVPSEFPVSAPIDAVKAQTIAVRTFALYHIMRARNIWNRKWDVTSTTQFQIYLGVEEEHPRSDRAIEETRGVILAYRGRVALTEYFSCTEMATDDDDSNPVASSRNIPSYIACEDFDHIYQNGGHGRGLPQLIVMKLAEEGWRPNADNLPTEDAVVPENFDQPWNYRDILFYFYNDVSLYHYTNIRLR